MADTAEPVSSPPELTSDLLCPKCGYNLRGLREYRCPECGDPFDPAVLAVSKLPWPQRRQLGRVRAYWRTVRLAAFHPRRLAAEIAYPTSYRDSQSFRWITIAFVWLTLLLSTLYHWDGHHNVSDGYHNVIWLLPDGGGEGIGMVIIDHLAALAALAVITGVPSYLFHPRALPVERQNRAIALSYYSAASLSVSPLVLVVVWLLNGICSDKTPLVALVLFTAVQYLLYWRSLFVLNVRGLALHNPGRTMVVAVLIPILQAIAGVTVYMLLTYSLKFLALLWLALFPS